MNNVETQPPKDAARPALAIVPPPGRFDDGDEALELQLASERVPPSDLDAEAAVLSAVIFDKTAFDKVNEFLRPEHFYSEAHRRVYEAVGVLYGDGKPVDAVTVATWLRDHDRLAQVGGVAYLTEILNAAPSLANVVHYAHAVRDRAERRELIWACQRIQAEGYVNRRDTAALVDDLARLVERQRISSRCTTERPTSADPLRGLDALRGVAVVGREALLELAARPVVYLWDGIAIDGIVTVISGDPGGGKSTLLFLLLAARMNTGAPVKVLGREVKPAPDGQFSVLIEAEHSESSSSRKVVQSVRLLGMDEAALDRLILVSRHAVKVGSREWQDIVRLVEAGLVSDIALDTLARVSPDGADPNAEKDQAELFGKIYEAIESAPNGVVQPSVWICTHNRKGGGEGLGAVSGSAQRTGQADTVLVVRANLDEHHRVVSSEVTFPKLRERPDDWPEKIIYTVSKDALAILEGESKDDRPPEERVIEYVKVFGPVTAGEMRKALRLNDRQVQAAVSRLFKDKKIAATNKVVRGKEVRAFEPTDAGLWRRQPDGEVPF